MATGNKTALLNSYVKELLFTGEAALLNNYLSLSIKNGENFLNSKGAINKQVPLKGDIKKAIKAALKKHFL